MHTHDAPWAVITGASRGLGSAFAEACAARGMRLALVALPGTQLEERARELERSHGVQVVFIEADLADKEGRLAFVDAIVERCRPIALLINNAGIGRNGRIDEIEPAFQARMVDLNVGATVELSRAFMPALVDAARSSGHASRLIIVSSLAAFQPMPLFGVYAATKSFLLHFGLALRHEAAELGVKVSVLCPGGILTNEEARAKISAQGLIGRLSSQEAFVVAETALRGAERGAPIVIPGWFNRLVRALGFWIPPDSAARAVYARWKTALKPDTGSPRRVKGLERFLGRLAYRMVIPRGSPSSSHSPGRRPDPGSREGEAPREVA